MNLLSISARNLRVRLLSSALTTVSIAVGIGLLAAIWLLLAQVEERYRASIGGYKVVIGPGEGSPLELVLNTAFNLGNSPGVLPLQVYFDLRDGKFGPRTRVRYAIPQARGDTYSRFNFPIVGTTDEMFTRFHPTGEAEGLAFVDGEGWRFGDDELKVFAREQARFAADPDYRGDGPIRREIHDDHAHVYLPESWLQAVIGSDVADKLGIGVGHEIVPVHGKTQQGVEAHTHDEFGCRVAGVLGRTGTPIDSSIFIPLGTFLSMDQHEAIRPDQQEAEPGSVLVSAIVVNPLDHLGGQVLRRALQTRGDAQVAWPAIEIPKLMRLVGDATKVLEVVSYLVLVVAGVSILVALYNTMNERRREIAIMRSLGARRWQISTIIVSEALIIAVVGGAIGVAGAHGAAWLLGDWVQGQAGVGLDPAAFSIGELWLILASGGLGGIAGILPAIKGSMTQIAENLNPTT